MLQRFSTNFAAFSIFMDLVAAFGMIHLSRVIRPFLDQNPIFKPLDNPPEIPPAILILFPLIWVLFMFFSRFMMGRKI